MPIVSIRYGAADKRQQKNWDLRCESNQAKQKGGARQAIHQPGLSHHLHPCPDQGDKLPGKEQAVVPMTESAQRQLNFSKLLARAVRDSVFSASRERICFIRREVYPVAQQKTRTRDQAKRMNPSRSLSLSEHHVRIEVSPAWREIMV
jgi:hypothetical protein